MFCMSNLLFDYFWNRLRRCFSFNCLFLYIGNRLSALVAEFRRLPNFFSAVWARFRKSMATFIAKLRSIAVRATT